MSSSVLSIRAGPSRNASIVRPAATVSWIVELTRANAAVSCWYAGRARFRYQRRPDREHRDRRDEGEAEDRRGEYQGRGGEHGGHCRNEQLRQPGSDRLRQVVHVGRGPGQEVPGAGALDQPERQVEDGPDELLAQPGEKPFAEHCTEAAGGAGEDRLHHEGADEQAAAKSIVEDPPWCGATPVDQVLEDLRADQTRGARHDLKADHQADERALLVEHRHHMPPGGTMPTRSGGCCFSAATSTVVMPHPL